MRYLGIDYGEKRIGISTSDIEGKLAFPKIVIENDSNLFDELIKIIDDEKIEAIVIGESRNYKNEENKINPKIISFKKELAEKTKLKISLEPEFMTSMQVEKTFGKTEMLDASAATIILQTFLDKERNREEKVKKEQNSRISIDDFTKVEMKVGKIISAEKIEGSDKLLKLAVDFKEEGLRQILSGIAKFYEPENLIGKKVVFITNLEPRKMMNLESNGMILAVHSEEKLALIEVPDFITEGSKLG